MQDLKSNQTCAQVVVSAQKSLQLSKRLEQFETQFPKMQSQFSKSTESIYYLVSTKFIRQWKSFIQDSSPNRLEISEMNIDIVNPETKLLQEGMLENQNFEIVNQQIYNIFEGFKVFVQLKRIAYMDGDEKKVPIHTVQIEYMTLTQKDLHAFDRKQKTRQHLTLTKISCLSQNNLVLDLKKAIESQEMINKNYQTRIWSHEKSITLDIFFNHILTQCGPLSFDLMKIKALGKLLDNVEQKLGDVGLEEGQYFILECIQYNKFVISAGDQGRCQSCYHYKKLPFPCGCKQVSYCTQQCLEKDRRHHIPRCKLAQQEQLKKAIQMVMRPTSRRGLVGLQNLGNTCFMNSCLQCLSHTLNLTNYFLQQRYSQEINQQNPIGSKGKLAQAYAAFIKNMWCQQQSTYRPYRLKSAIADINKMFSGYAQHDSQELFSFLVDGLHEDLNRIKRKPYVESVDSNGRTDQIVSHESWLAYIKRNQSIISDNMVGQYRSKVVCPDCGKQSITFDPFITVTLPIPEKISNIMELFVLRQDNQQQTIKISVRYRERSVEQIIKQISINIEKPSSDFLCYVLTFQENIYPFHNTPKTELFSKIQFLHSQIFVIQISNQEKQLQNRIQIPCRFTKKEYNRFESFWFKRPFFFNIEQATGLTLLKRVLKYFYHDTYNCSIKRTQMQKSQNKWKKVEEGKSYQQYEAYMLKNRPCKVYVKWNKRMKYSYSLNSQIEFEQQKCIEDDQMLKDFIDLNNLQNYEIQYRFNAVGLENFSIKRLRNFSQKKTHHGSEMVDESQGNMSLDDCFEALQTPELLQKGNEWYCPSCKDHKLATKQINIYKTPQVLILHLKRFKVKAITRRQKNEANVNFPFNLDMSRYVLNQKPINDYIPYVKSQNVYIQPSYELIVNPNANPHYELYAISNHYGSLGGGHYTAYAKNEDKWYSFNDSSVSGVNADKVKGSGAYILFYRRRPN